MSTAIQVETIATNRYAPKGAEAINLYAVSGVYGLTLGQLMMAICIRSASAIEEQSVLKMNDLNASAAYLEALSQCGEYVMEKRSLLAKFDLSETGYVPKHVSEKTTYRAFMVDEVGIQSELVPDSVTSTDEKTRVFGYLADEMDRAASDNEQQTIDLQSLLSRRDSTFNASASTVKNLGTSMNLVANNF